MRHGLEEYVDQIAAMLWGSFDAVDKAQEIVSLFDKRTCDTCKHWSRRGSSEYGDCSKLGEYQEGVVGIRDGVRSKEYSSPSSFGCALYEEALVEEAEVTA
jgi:hypothetical protein